jgi:beta-phosphoglucomutase
MDSRPPRDDVRAVLWDLDGTLIDSRELHWLAWREALRAEAFILTPDQFARDFGRRNDEILRGHFGDDLPANEIDRIATTKEVYYRRLVGERGIELLPGARHWLERLAAEGWRQTLATSAPRANVEAIVAALALETLLAAFVSAEDVERGKPDPQVFLAAAAKAGAPPWRCIVVEDAPAGVEGGRRAGMRTIGVLTTHAALDADVVVRSLSDLPPDAFERLLDR